VSAREIQKSDDPAKTTSVEKASPLKQAKLDEALDRAGRVHALASEIAEKSSELNQQLA
jgi:hypothetical protein